MAVYTLTREAVEKSTYAIEVEFKNEDGEYTTPNELTWSLTDGDGNVINSRNQFAVTPFSSGEFVLTGNDLLIQDSEASPAERRFLIEGTYDSTRGNNLPIREECVFYVRDLISKK